MLLCVDCKQLTVSLCGGLIKGGKVREIIGREIIYNKRKQWEKKERLKKKEIIKLKKTTR